MNPSPQLVPMLKQLRLSGICDSLERHNREAINQKLAYTEFLALLLQDEVARREHKNFASRHRRACFRGEKTIENFDFDHTPTTNRELIKDLATGSYIRDKANVLIVGPCGTGKSHVAQALGHCALRQGHEVLFATQSKLLNQLNAARGVGSYEKRLAHLTQVDLLIIDDFGLKPLEPKHAEDLHDIIAERYENRPTIVTSNLDLTEWGEAFPNRILGAATLDRLRHDAHRIVLDGKSYRLPRPFSGLQNTPLKPVDK